MSVEQKKGFMRKKMADFLADADDLVSQEIELDKEHTEVSGRLHKEYALMSKQTGDCL